ncbi:MAG: hypothetical protein K9L86_07845 [Candidatus Omnitrophica bacterium]|nr:hypothetical protein [Candidatus Omnitrophota bacterium]
MSVKIISFGKRHFVSLFVSISLFLHFIFVFWCSFYIETAPSPSVYAWTNIIGKKDLFFEKKLIQFPEKAFSSVDPLRREYFSASFLNEDYFQRKHKEQIDILPYVSKVSFDDAILSQKRKQYVYLWERNAVLSSWEEEVIPYRVYVSNHGRVIFLYPEKLSVNSYENLNFQDYIRESTQFLGDKFFWTKLEAVVK